MQPELNTTFVWLQASRNSKVSVEGTKKLKAEDLAQRFNRKRLAAQQSKSDVVTSKVLKRKVPDSEETAEQSKAKSLKCKVQRPRPGALESKGCDGNITSETDGKVLPNSQAGAASKASTTSSGLVAFPAMMNLVC